MRTALTETDPGEAVLDNAVWASLTGAHAELAEVMGTVRRYRRAISPFIGIPTSVTAQVWADLARLAGSGAVVPIAGTAVTPPDGWEQVDSIRGVQLVATDAVVGAVDPEAVRLGADDVPDMLALVERTQPGPFAPETYVLGNYVGIRRGGRLIAMAGQRLNPPGWAEISAVCTDADYRGQGLGSRLVLTVAALIRAQGERPFMHAAASNTNAIRLYESLGFRLRKHTRFSAVRVP
jgi:ribosomal protein S18 acetylase RimI-like enzyme